MAGRKEKGAPRAREAEAGAKLCRPGGRSERVVAGVLDATANELAAHGYVALRIEDVAERAGVNKTTIYRRWPTKADLVEATIATFGLRPTTPDPIGTLEEQLTALALDFGAGASCERRLFIGRVMTNEGDVPEVAAIMQSARARFKKPWLLVVRRAVDRSELPEGTDVELFVDTFVAALAARMFRDRKRIDAAFIDAVLGLLLVGARAGGAVSRRARRARTAAQ